MRKRPIFKTIPAIALSDEGPVSAKTANSAKPQCVHLRQGGLDGACGPYSFFMAMIALGLEKYSKLTSLEESKTSKAVFKLVYQKSSSLIREGTDINLMIKYAQLYEKYGLGYEGKLAELHGNRSEAKKGKVRSFVELRGFVLKHLRLGHPVVLGTVEHWVLAVGLGYDSDDCFKNDEPRYLLVLDPDEESPELMLWNGVFDLQNHNHWLGQSRGGVRFEAAIALWIEL